MNKHVEQATKLRDSEQYVAKSWIRKHWKRSKATQTMKEAGKAMKCA